MTKPDTRTWLEKENTRRRRKTLKASASVAIDNPGLPIRPWMKILALWISQQPRKPKKKDMLAQARLYSKARLTMRELNRLLERKDFQKHVEALMGEEEVKARALFVSQMVPAVSHHFNALEKLIERGEYKDVAKFTMPYIERAYPAKQDRAEKQPTVVINLGSSEFAKRYLEAGPGEERDEIVIESNEVTVITEST
jgi:hypothetical protein